jgi:hypothetical protein
MGGQRSYQDEDLEAVVAASRSWRGVLRELGLSATSASAIRSVRHHADRLGLDHSHFTGLRRWTDEQLSEAISGSASWSQVAQALGLMGGSSESALKGHAARLGIDVDHLRQEPLTRGTNSTEMLPDLRNLPRAASMLAAAWFTLCGHDVSWPLEPCRYDLLVRFDEKFERIQVKTTRVRSGATWDVWLSNTRKGRITYDPDEIDYFFVVDGELGYYLIPVAAVGGLHAIRLSGYSEYKVGDAGAWIRSVSDSAVVCGSGGHSSPDKS